MNSCLAAFIFYFINLLARCFGIEPPKWMIEDGRMKYNEYEKCLIMREQNLHRFQSSGRFHSVLALPGSVVTLKCFECLDPADATSIEDVWKPNESLISRKLRKQFDKIKEAIKRSKNDTDEGKKKADKTITHYYWEFLSINDKRRIWRPVVDMHEPVKATARVAKMMRNFLSRNKQRYAIGNHFELEIQRSNMTETGWYRCVQRTKSADKSIANGFFVDIVRDYKTRMMAADDSAILTHIQPMQIEGFVNLEIVYQNMSQTLCNRCGNGVIGEKRHQLSCFIRARASRREFADKSALSVFQLIPEIPCSSALLPENLKAKLRYDYDVIEVFQPCRMACPLSHNDTRLVEGFDEDGSPLTLDRLEPGEFTMNERLPPLRPPVRRKVIRRKAGDSVVLDCGSFTEGKGLVWKFNDVELNSAAMLGQSERKLISSKSRLIIRKLETVDEGTYTCTTVTKETAAIFLVYVSVSVGKAGEYVSTLQLVLRFITVMLLLYLFVSAMRKITSKMESKHEINPEPVQVEGKP